MPIGTQSAFAFLFAGGGVKVRDKRDVQGVLCAARGAQVGADARAGRHVHLEAGRHVGLQPEGAGGRRQDLSGEQVFRKPNYPSELGSVVHIINIFHFSCVFN